jgi:hypothetical protein
MADTKAHNAFASRKVSDAFWSEPCAPYHQRIKPRQALGSEKRLVGRIEEIDLDIVAEQRSLKIGAAEHMVRDPNDEFSLCRHLRPVESLARARCHPF